MACLSVVLHSYLWATTGYILLGEAFGAFKDIITIRIQERYRQGIYDYKPLWFQLVLVGDSQVAWVIYLSRPYSHDPDRSPILDANSFANIHELHAA